MRRDPVTPEMAQAVMRRDMLATIRWLDADPERTASEIHSWFRMHPTCVAPLLDRSQLASCWGRSTLDHIHEEMGVGKPRAKSDMKHLVTLCQGHTEDGRKAGYQWNTAHRPEIRDYLATVNREG